MAAQNKVSDIRMRSRRRGVEQKRRTVEWAWEVPLYLAQKGVRTTAQLAEIFHVSKRTISHLMARLYAIGVPVYQHKVPGHAALVWDIHAGTVKSMFERK